MNWWDLRNIKNKDFLSSLWAIFFLILPGVAAIFIFEQNLFLKLSWPILVLLSASITFPFIAMNTVVVSAWDKVKPSDKEGFFYSFLLSAMATGLAAYIGMALGYYLHQSLRSMLEFAVIADLAICGFIAAKDWREERREKRLKKQRQFRTTLIKFPKLSLVKVWQKNGIKVLSAGNVILQAAARKSSSFISASSRMPSKVPRASSLCSGTIVVITLPSIFLRNFT